MVVAAYLKKKSVRILLVLALFVLVYGLAGFLLAPRLIRSGLVDNVHKTLDLTPTVGEIHLNPFLLQVEIKDFSLPDRQGVELVGFKRLYVDLGIASLWRRGVVLKDIEIARPVVHAVVAADGNLNLMALKPKSTEPEPPRDPNAPLPRIWIAAFTVADGLATYDDQRLPDHFETRLEPVNFDLRDFSTGVDGGLFDFSGASKLGERVEWHGHLTVQPLESDGEFKLTGLRAHTLWEYVEQQLNFAIPSGTIDLRAHYRFSLRDALDLKLKLDEFKLADLTVRPKGADLDWVTVPELIVAGTDVDLAGHDAKIDSVRLNGLKLVTWVEADHSVNLAKLGLAARDGSVTPTAPAAPVVPPPPAAAATPASPAWHVALRELALQDATISAEDRGVKPAAKLVLAPLSLTVAGASSDLTKPVKITFATGLGGDARLGAAGEVTPAPLAAAISLQVNQIDLAMLQPYIAKFTAMTLLGGRLNGDLKLHYGGKPMISAAGAVSVDDLHTIDNALKDDFLSWKRLDVTGIQYTQGPDRLAIDDIALKQPYARIIIESDDSVNIKRILAGPAGAGPVVITETATGPAASVPPPAPRPPATARPGKAPVAAPPSMPIVIRKVELADGKVNFSDLSVAPNFSAGIQALKGSISGLSSDPKSRAKVDLHGEVDPFAPVSITGDLNVLSPSLYTDLAMSFRNIELSIFNPYSGKFAGYDISKGKLTTEMHYKVEGSSLDAQHHVIIDQLEFGEKTASKDAVSLPVRLAVSLLKDRNGVIEIDLPVSGSLDNPKFNLGPEIRRVIVNILEKLITAPFAALGRLFSGGPDLQFVDFQAGAAELEPAAVDRLKGVAKALAERPQLKIEVPIAAAPELDRPALVDAKFAALVAKQAPAPVAALDPSAQLAVLTKVYAAATGSPPKYPDEVLAIKPKADADKAKLEVVKKVLKNGITVSDAELESLAQARAQVVQQALLGDSGLDPERVFLVVNDKMKAQDGAVRLELTLK
jgi:uncharacterized protein involved in outer membrane biogenesis